jgi:predicted RNA-binding Zn-ribbon protein involved in translation (DUF1610 family)
MSTTDRPDNLGAFREAVVLRDGIGAGELELVTCSRCKAGVDVELGVELAGEPGVRSFTCPGCGATFARYSSAWLSSKGGAQ